MQITEASSVRKEILEDDYMSCSILSFYIRERTSENQLQDEQTHVEGNLKYSYLATYQPGIPDLQHSFSVMFCEIELDGGLQYEDTTTGVPYPSPTQHTIRKRGLTCLPTNIGQVLRPSGRVFMGHHCGQKSREVLLLRHQLLHTDACLPASLCYSDAQKQVQLHISPAEHWL